MGTSSTQAGNFRSTIGRIVMALVCASFIGGILTAPAFAEGDRGKHKEWKKKSRRAYHPPPPRRYYYDPPPPVVYAPAPYQSPGISIVFPLY